MDYLSLKGFLLMTCVGFGETIKNHSCRGYHYTEWFCGGKTVNFAYFLGYTVIPLYHLRAGVEL